jgi:hypothetical protein
MFVSGWFINEMVNRIPSNPDHKKARYATRGRDFKPIWNKGKSETLDRLSRFLTYTCAY